MLIIPLSYYLKANMTRPSTPELTQDFIIQVKETGEDSGEDWGFPEVPVDNQGQCDSSGITYFL